MGCDCNSSTKCVNTNLIDRVKKPINKLNTLIVISGDPTGEYKEIQDDLQQYKTTCIGRGMLVELENYVENECTKYDN